MTPEEALRRVLVNSGIAFPRGVLGSEAQRLARALDDGLENAAELQRLCRGVTDQHWHELREPLGLMLDRAAERAEPDDAQAYRIAAGWAADPDPGNPLALALAARAGAELAVAVARSLDRLEAIEAQVARGDRRAPAAVARVAGQNAVDLLDLDPDDFEPEIVEYVDAAQGQAAVDALARATGDEETRRWAREALRGLDAPEAPAALAVLRDLVQTPLPDDPAEDPVWVAAVLALADQAIELALASDVDEGE